MVDWNLLRPVDITGNALAAFQQGRQDRQAQTDRQNALYRQEQDDAWRAEQQGRQRQAWDRQDEEYAADQKAELGQQALNIAKSLRILPQEQRGALYAQQGVPVLQKLGVPDADIQRVLADGLLTDQELDGFIVQFGGVLEAPEGPKYQVLPGPDGMVGYTAQIGAAPPTYTRLQEPIVDPLDVQLKRARIGSANRGNRGGAGGASSGSAPPMGRSLGSGAEPNW